MGLRVMSPTGILKVTWRKRNYLRIVHTVSIYRFEVSQALQRLRIICWHYYAYSREIVVLRSNVDAIAIALL